MMITCRKPTACAALASLLALSGCTMAPAPREIVMQRSGLEGQWMDQGGIAVSTFNDGRFVSVDARSGARLSEGSYQMRDGQNISISMISLARGMQVEVNCLRAAPNQLNCTNAMGQNFVLTRQG